MMLKIASQVGQNGPTQHASMATQCHQRSSRHSTRSKGNRKSCNLGGRAGSVAKHLMLAALVIKLTTATDTTNHNTHVSNRVVAIDTVRKWQRSMQFGEFVYLEPPCSSHCGESITKCTDKGYFTDEMYIYWRENDAGKVVCNAFKVPMYSGWLRTLSTYNAGWAAISVLSALKDGTLDPSDIITVGVTWMVKWDVDKPVSEAETVERDLLNDGSPGDEM